MNKDLVTKFVLLGKAGFDVEGAIAAANDIEILADHPNDLHGLMAVCRLNENEAVLVWLKSQSQHGTYHEIHGRRFCTVGSTYTFSWDGRYLERDIAIYVACKRLGVTRLRSVEPPAIPGIVGVSEQLNSPLKEWSFEEQVQAWQRRGVHTACGHEEELAYLATLKERCLEIGGG